MAYTLRNLWDDTVGWSWRQAMRSPGNKWLPWSGESAWLADQKQKQLNVDAQSLAPAHGEAPVSPAPAPWSLSGAVSDAASAAKDLLNKDKDPDGHSASWYWRTLMGNGSSSGSQPQFSDALSYLDAPWASAYGMSKETAYSEAMENTAYRRSVADMQKAGLNPAVIFGAGNGYTAGSPSYISSTRSGGSGSGRRSGSSSSKSNQNGKLFSGSAYSIISALGGIVGAAATHSAGGYWIGTSLAQGAMSALNAFSRK